MSLQLYQGELHISGFESHMAILKVLGHLKYFKDVWVKCLRGLRCITKPFKVFKGFKACGSIYFI